MFQISQKEMRRFYELSYKYQMLKKEMEIGDYGLQQVLPDSAYLLFAQVQNELIELLHTLQQKMLAGYEIWLRDHEVSDDDEDEVRKDMLWTWRGYGNLYKLQNFTNLTEEESLSLMRDTVPEAEGMDDDALLHDKNMYIEMLDSLTYGDHPLVEKQFKPYLKWFKEQNATDHNSEEIQEMLNKLDTEWNYGLDPSGLNANFQLFHEALTTAHGSGEMAEHIISGSNATALLTALSQGEGVDEWDQDLSRVLGYPVRSRYIQPDEWITARLQRVIAALQNSC